MLECFLLLEIMFLSLFWNCQPVFLMNGSKGLSARINRGRKWYQSIGFLLRMSRWSCIFFNFQPPSVQKHKTIKRDLIGITWGCLIHFKRRNKYVVAAHEAELLYLYRYLRQRNIIIPLLEAPLII